LTGDPTLAEASAFTIGQELHAVGINLNLAPVVDIHTNPLNPIIGDRSFGPSPDIVISFARQALRGYHKGGVLTSLKHFPGHGDTAVDSHKDLPILYKSKEELQQTELLPFAALAKEADTIMTAHLLIPSIDPVNCVTLSKSILDILRHEIGFTGVILSDSLVMAGLLKNCASIEEAAISAFTAGCDILLLGGKQLSRSDMTAELTEKDIERVHLALLKAVQSGQIPEARVDESVERILALKHKESDYEP
jgi:beta-N-acetylhexosaminidase